MRRAGLHMAVALGSTDPVRHVTDGVDVQNVAGLQPGTAARR